jgi:hypothetical protein
MKIMEENSKELKEKLFNKKELVGIQLMTEKKKLFILFQMDI